MEDVSVQFEVLSVRGLQKIVLGCYETRLFELISEPNFTSDL
jgi:hypothetical protein